MTDAIALTTSMPGPWGPIHLAATDRGVVAIAWLTSESDFTIDVTRRLGGPVAAATADHPDDMRTRYLRSAMAALEALFAARPDGPSVAFDLHDRPAWDRDVLTAVAAIPWGTTVSYGEIARRVGSPRAARAVGGAVGRNPISLLIPCHRVIAADGSIGGYGADAWGSPEDRLEMKRDLLAREGVEVVRVRTAGSDASGRHR